MDITKFKLLLESIEGSQQETRHYKEICLVFLLDLSLDLIEVVQLVSFRARAAIGSQMRRFDFTLSMVCRYHKVGTTLLLQHSILSKLVQHASLRTFAVRRSASYYLYLRPACSRRTGLRRAGVERIFPTLLVIPAQRVNRVA